MNVVPKRTLVAATLFLMALPVVASGATTTQVSYASVSPVEAQEMVLKTQALALKRLDFEVFAKSKVQQLNRNHKFSRTRMEVTKKPDGTYRARYHQIDDSTLSVKVRRSQSGAIPYVGVLSYKEQIFESSAKTVEQLDQSLFAVVKIIPNRHIFSYQKGAWK